MIHLKDNYYISADTYGWTLQVKTGVDKDGRDVYRPLGYYGTVDQAVRAYVNRRILDRISDGTFEINEALAIIRAENAQLMGLVRKVQAYED